MLILGHRKYKIYYIGPNLQVTAHVRFLQGGTNFVSRATDLMFHATCMAKGPGEREEKKRAGPNATYGVPD